MTQWRNGIHIFPSSHTGDGVGGAVTLVEHEADESLDLVKKCHPSKQNQNGPGNHGGHHLLIPGRLLEN